jgi:two-component system NtrC family sensor kinase
MQDDRFYRFFDKQSGFHTRSIMCVPLRANGYTIGTIELMNMRPDYLSDTGLKILSVIADHAALAIENARLFEETRQRSEEQALLFEAMAILTSDLGLETVLDAVSRQMVEALKADLCIISSWDKHHNQLRTMQSYAGPGVKRMNQVTRSLEGVSFPLSILISQKPGILEANASDILPEQTAWLQALNVQALFLIPLLYHRQTIGLVELGRTFNTEPLTQGELRLLETMTAQAAVAIEHARLYDEATRRLAEAKVLQEVMVAAASSLDFDRVLSGTISALHRTLGVERLGFFLPTAEGDAVVAHPATIGFSCDEDKSTLPMEGSAVGWVIRKGKPLLLSNVHEAIDYGLTAETQAQICIPVILNGQVVAVLKAESSRPNAFNREDLRLFNAIAAELAVALENARLFAEILAAEANYRDLFDNANDFIFTLDSNLRISSANKAVLKTSGYQLDEIIGVHASHFVKPHQIPALLKLLKMRLASFESPATFELPVIGKNGQETLLELTFRVRRVGRRPVSIHCIARDVTHRHELEQQLQQTEKLSAIGKLVAGVAHELNNPLTTIIGYSALLQQNDLPIDFRTDLDVIFRQAQRARLIVRDLLTFARRFELETQEVDVNAVITGSLSLMTPHLRASAVQVKTNLDLDLPPTIADPHQLEQVFINLITNAMQALCTVSEPRHLTIESRQAGEYILLSFADNGPGIPGDALSRVFDPFFSTKQVGQGTGLGLSICFGIISQHKGHIWAENAPEGGAIFRLELPIEKPVAPPEPAPPEPTPTDLPIALRILAIDDEPELLNLLYRILTSKGHTTEIVLDGKTALQRLEEQTYDLIICDMLMPDILGAQLYQKIVEKFPHLADHFIFITGNIVDLDTRLFLEQSGLPWLSKPFLPIDMEKVVAQMGAKIQNLHLVAD